MYIILGATGHIGSVVTAELLKNKQQVTVVTRSEAKRAQLEGEGANVAVTDVMDTDKLRKVFAGGTQLFLLNPPGSPDKDMEKQENESLDSILRALKDSPVKKVVAQSTYGAQHGTGIGDLGILFRMEQELSALPVHATVVRGAYYMSNWDMYMETARNEGKIYSLFPVDFKLPMAAPGDIGAFAAQLLMEPATSTGLHFVEGPQFYSPDDVAAAFARALQRQVAAVAIPEEEWTSFLTSFGFTEESARTLGNMTRLTLEKSGQWPSAPHRGHTTIDDYIAGLVRK